MSARPNANAALTGPAPPLRRAPAWLVAAVLAVHVALILGLTGPLEWRLQTAEPVRVAPMQTRWVPPTPAPKATPVQAAAPKPRTRVATEPKAAPAPSVEPATAPPVDVASANDNSAAEPLPQQTAQAHAELPASAEASGHSASPNTSVPVPDTPTPAAPPETASVTLPPIPLGALPPPVLLSYRLTGQDKGLTYHASGELRWQHNDTDYELTLAVRAFLIGRRQWRSVGRIEATGLGPVRFSDSWRNERAAHFDRAQQRIVFSSNSNPAVLESGAQDQISLYVQLAAAMAGEPERFVPGTRLQVQTATVRDAQPWSLVLDSRETLKVEGQVLEVAKWVCQPFNRYEARVEFWVAAAQDWLPVRIRITQASGSYIDLLWRGSDPLPALPAGADTTVGTRGS